MDSNAPTPEPKRRKLQLKVSLESNADGRVPVFQAFADGTCTPAIESHFDRTSAAATAFATRALAPPAPASASADTRATDSGADPSHPNPQWAANAVTNIEGALYELGRAITVIEALRADTPLLALSRVEPKQTPTSTPAAAGIPSNLIKDGSAILMAKRRTITTVADSITATTDALKAWVDTDNAFCDSVLTLRKKCCGLRRNPNGLPLIDVGSNDFTSVKRPTNITNNVSTDQHPSTDTTVNEDTNHILQLQFPASMYLRFALSAVEDPAELCTAPTVVETPAERSDQSLNAIIRRIRLSRVSAWRRVSFERLAREATNAPSTTHLTTNSIGFESGPSDLIRLQRTQRSASALSIDPWPTDDPVLPTAEEYDRVQTSSLLQIITTRASLIHAADPPVQPTTPLLDYLLDFTSSRRVLAETEKILDRAAKLLRLRLEWSRGSARTAETRVRVHATDADGDGPSRALAVVEPVSMLNDGAHAAHRGHVRITPSFGVIIPAPDDPSARGRAIPLPSSSSSGASALGLDDVPRSYICPIGGEVLSVFTLLLCIRLLDVLETAARAGVAEMLDVDRQCFTVVVSSPRTGRTLKVKAWPRGETVGHEVPGATAWLDGQKVSFPQVGPGRLKAWKVLLLRLMKFKKDEELVQKMEEDDAKQEDNIMTDVVKEEASAVQVRTTQQEQGVPAVSLQVPSVAGEGLQAVQAQLQAQLHGQTVSDSESTPMTSQNQIGVAGNMNSTPFSLDGSGNDGNQFDFESYMT